MVVEANGSNPLLTVSDLEKNYRGLRAVQGLGFSVDSNQVTALIGPNGAGKTTVFSIIAGDLPADGGSVVFRDVNLLELASHQVCAAGIGRTFQNPRLFGQLSCLENVLAARYVRSRSSVLQSVLNVATARTERADDVRRAWELLTRVGLAGSARLRPAQLSYGNMRRLEIARALATEPALLLMDEPSAGMAVHVIDEIMAMLQDLIADGLTILLIEHNMRVVSAIASKVIVMDHGVKIGEGTADEVLRSPAVIEAYIGAP